METPRRRQPSSRLERRLTRRVRLRARPTKGSRAPVDVMRSYEIVWLDKGAQSGDERSF